MTEVLTMDEYASLRKIEFELCGGNLPEKYKAFVRRVLNDRNLIPAADVAQVVHGLWEKEPSSFWRWTPSGAVAVARTTYRCGLCGRGTAVKSNYCPNCGAKMDGNADG
jgi:rubrerythrin